MNVNVSVGEIGVYIHILNKPTRRKAVSKERVCALLSKLSATQQTTVAQVELCCVTVGFLKKVEYSS